MPNIKGNIIEINKRIIANPQLIIENGDIEGYIAICQCFNYQWTSRKNPMNEKKGRKHLIENNLLTEEQYQDYLKEFNIILN